MWPPTGGLPPSSGVPLLRLGAHALAAVRREGGKLRERLAREVAGDAHQEEAPAFAAGRAVGVGRRGLWLRGADDREAVLHQGEEVGRVPGPQQHRAGAAAALRGQPDALGAKVVDEGVQAAAQRLPGRRGLQHLEVEGLQVGLVARSGQRRQHVGGEAARLCAALLPPGDDHLFVLLHGTHVQVGEPHVQSLGQNLQLTGRALCAIKDGRQAV
mmetsp:Transcript_34978/g.100410  ORF Transcript_34978/g.100410 Transcript_34978/m.100410 type:complete len:214 (+) Transcript_34978:218-859(+)